MACMQLQVVVLLVVLSLWWSKWQLSGSLGTRLMMLYFLYLLLNVVRAPSPPPRTHTTTQHTRKAEPDLRFDASWIPFLSHTALSCCVCGS